MHPLWIYWKKQRVPPYYVIVRHLILCSLGVTYDHCVFLVITSDANGQVICKNQFSFFVVGMTGFGGKKNSSLEKVCIYL